MCFLRKDRQCHYLVSRYIHNIVKRQRSVYKSYSWPWYIIRVYQLNVLNALNSVQKRLNLSLHKGCSCTAPTQPSANGSCSARFLAIQGTL